MKKLILFLFFALVINTIYAQQVLSGNDYIYKYQVGVGKTTATPIVPTLTNPAAWLEIGKDSTNKAIRLPRVVDTIAISSPVNGLFLYQIKDSTLYFRTKSRWVKVSDVATLTGYVKISDSTVYYYPLNSNPKGYITTETDPVANAKTIDITAGTGIIVGPSGGQQVGNNPAFVISANNNDAIWDANSLQNISVSAAAPTVSDVLQFNGLNWAPAPINALGTVTSVGLSLPPDVFNISGSPVTTTGTLTGTFKNQLSNLFWASPNGISGAPTFRAMANEDLPLSGVIAGTYGSDTSTAQITVNAQGIATSIVNTPIDFSKGHWSLLGNNIYNNNTNNVGVGTTTPAHTLHVLAPDIGGFAVQNTMALGAGSGGFVRALQTGTPSAAGQGLGGVAIGTNPTGSTFRLTAQVDAFSEAAWTDGTSQPTYLRFSTTNPGVASISEKMRITAAGGMGIGTTVPEFEGLHLMRLASTITTEATQAYTAISGGLLAAVNTGTPSAINQRLGLLGFGSSPVGAAPLRLASAVEAFSEGAWTDNVAHPSDLRFYTTNTGANSATEKVRITAAGNVGIGTTLPTGKLHVNATNPLTLTGVQLGAVTDSLLTIASGVVRKLVPGSFINNSTSIQTANFNVSGTGRVGSTFTVAGNAIFSANGTPGVGKVPTGTDGVGNWTWNAVNTELIAVLDNIDVMTANTYTLIPAVAGKRVILTFGVYEKRSTTGTGTQTFTPTGGTNAPDYDNMLTTGSGGSISDANPVGAYTGFLAPQVTQSIDSNPVVLKIVPGPAVLTSATIRVFVRYALMDL